MDKLVVGTFTSKKGPLEAGRVLHAAGYSRQDLVLLSLEREIDPGLASAVQPVRIERLLRSYESLDRVPRAVLRGAFMAGVICAVPSFGWLGLGAIGGSEWFLGADSWAMRLLLATTLWKFCIVIGAFWGIYAGISYGVEPELATFYESHLALGSQLLAVPARRRDAPKVRGLFIESGAIDVRDLQGGFFVPERQQKPKRTPVRR